MCVCACQMKLPELPCQLLESEISSLARNNLHLKDVDLYIRRLSLFPALVDTADNKRTFVSSTTVVPHFYINICFLNTTKTKYGY